jgi:hypothetical protein
MNNLIIKKQLFLIKNKTILRQIVAVIAVVVAKCHLVIKLFIRI